MAGTTPNRSTPADLRLRANRLKSETTAKPWDGSPARFGDTEAYCTSCLINENTGDDPSTWVQAACKLPVNEPDGTINVNAVHAAAAALAGARGGIDASGPAKKSAARKLRKIYAAMQEPLPPSIKAML